jgi:HK97 family phage portal protein
MGIFKNKKLEEKTQDLIASEIKKGIDSYVETQKEVLKAEITELVDKDVSGKAKLHDWTPSDNKDGRPVKVNFRTLDIVYKKVSWVRGCIDAIARSCTSNGFQLVTTDPNDKNPLTRGETKKIMKLLTSPNTNDSFSDVIAEVATDLHLYGDAYLEIAFDDKTRLPKALYNVVDSVGTVQGYIQNGVVTGGKPVVFRPHEIVHFKLPNPGNAVYGLAPIESLWMPIQTDIAAQEYNLNFFKNNATPKLHVDMGNCTLPQLKRTKEFFNREFRGSPHKTIVTEGGMTIKPIGVSPVDMEFLNQRKFSRDEICAVFGVPAMKLGVYEDVNRASAKEADKSFKSEKIIPLQRSIANKLNKSVISLFKKPRVKFEFTELDLRDEKEQAAIDQINIQSGIMTVNEVRKRKGLPPRDPKELSEFLNPRQNQGSKPTDEERSETEHDAQADRVEQQYYLTEPLEKFKEIIKDNEDNAIAGNLNFR